MIEGMGIAPYIYQFTNDLKKTAVYTAISVTAASFFEPYYLSLFLFANIFAAVEYVRGKF